MPQIPSPSSTVQDELFQVFMEDDPPSASLVIALGQRVAQLSRLHTVILWDDLIEKRTVHPWAGASMAELAQAWTVADPKQASNVVSNPGFVAVLGRVCVKGLVLLMDQFLTAGAPRATRHRMTLPPPSVHPLATGRLASLEDPGWSLLHLAAWCGDVTMVDRLLAHGVDLHTSSDGGITPLHAALMSRRPRTEDVVLRLLDAGAIAQANRPASVLKGRTPPQVAHMFLTEKAWVMARQRWEQGHLHQILDESPESWRPGPTGGPTRPRL